MEVRHTGGTPPMGHNAAERSGAGRDRLLITAALGAALLFCWGYLLYMVWGMVHMDVGADMLIMPRMIEWRETDVLLVFLMWTIMMAAMMLPSAAPMILIFSRIVRERSQGRRAFVATCVFVCGYLSVWAGFSLLATLAQWALLEARLVSPMMKSASPFLSAALLAAAGVFQFTPLKHACLAKCRSPVSFILTEWRDTTRGAFVMGIRHGFFCVGCCWLLMLLLFVFGVMNVLWIVVLTALVLMEKFLRDARWLDRAIGFVFLAWGALVAGQAIFVTREALTLSGQMILEACS